MFSEKNVAMVFYTSIVIIYLVITSCNSQFGQQSAKPMHV